MAESGLGRVPGDRAGGRHACGAEGRQLRRQDRRRPTPQREAALAKRRDPVTGVSEFPNILETPIARGGRICRRCVRRGQRAAGGVRADHAAATARCRRSPRQAPAAVAEADGRGRGRRCHPRRDGQRCWAAAKRAIAPLPSHRYGEQLRGAARCLRRLLRKDRRAADDLPRQSRVRSPSTPGARPSPRTSSRRRGIEAARQRRLRRCRGVRRRVQGKRCADRHPLLRRSRCTRRWSRPVAPALKAAGCEYLFLAGAPGRQEGRLQGRRYRRLHLHGRRRAADHARHPRAAGSDLTMTTIPDFTADRPQPGEAARRGAMAYADWAERFDAETGKSPEHFVWETPEADTGEAALHRGGPRWSRPSRHDAGRSRPICAARIRRCT